MVTSMPAWPGSTGSFLLICHSLAEKGGMKMDFGTFIQLLKVILLIFKMFKQNKFYRVQITVVVIFTNKDRN